MQIKYVFIIITAPIHYILLKGDFMICISLEHGMHLTRGRSDGRIALADDGVISARRYQMRTRICETCSLKNSKRCPGPDLCERVLQESNHGN